MGGRPKMAPPGATGEGDNGHYVNPSVRREKAAAAGGEVAGRRVLDAGRLPQGVGKQPRNTRRPVAPASRFPFRPPGVPNRGQTENRKIAARRATQHIPREDARGKIPAGRPG